MSNRTLAFLLLIVICALALSWVYYFFIANVWSLQISITWAETSKVTLISEFWNPYETTCSKTCIFKDIPPVWYELSITSAWFKTETKSFSLSRWEQKELDFSLIKLAKAEKLDISTKESKVSALRLKDFLSKSNFAWTAKALWFYSWKSYFYSLWDDFSIYSLEWWDKQTLIFSMPTSDIKDIIFFDISWFISFSGWWQSYIFDIDSLKSFPLNIDEKPIIIKRTQSYSKILISTSVWTYLYDLDTLVWKKNTLFDDFVLLWDNKVIWLLRASSKDKMSLLNFDLNSKAKIVLHNIDTKERKMIFETDIQANYIALYNWNPIIVDDKWNLYELKDLDLGVNNK